MLEEWKERQLAVCEEHHVSPLEVRPEQKVGVARNLRSGLLPINGVRHLPEHGTCGWYIWAGEMSDDPDFFVPVHVAHLPDWCLAAMPFLLLPTGWRFLLADDYADIWFDPNVDVEPMPPPAT